MYFKVKAKCGHVGKNNYIIKTFYVKAESGKAAALLVRNMPRVKHNQKDAICIVIKIEYDEYRIGLKESINDFYFRVHNIQDQKKLNCVLHEEIYLEEKAIKKEKKDKSIMTKNRLKFEIIRRETMRMLRSRCYD